MNIVLLTSLEEQSSRLQALLTRWRPRIEQINGNDHILEVCEDCFQLRLSSQPKVGAVSVDFLAPTAEYRRKFGGGKGQIIAKAVGIKQGIFPSIVDATAGFGRDAFVLASLGCRVHMLERSPVMVLLLEDGLERAKMDEEIGGWVSERLSLDFQDSCEGLASLPFKPDVVYLDPIYPEKKKSALVKKEMRILKSLVGKDTDADTLFKVALGVAQGRVVIKRPVHAGWMNDQKPNMSFETKKNRFDLYLV